MAGPELVRARDHHVTFVDQVTAGTFLYAIAGASSTGFPLDYAERAAIAEDGSLGLFEEVEDLPNGLAGSSVAQVPAWERNLERNRERKRNRERGE